MDAKKIYKVKVKCLVETLVFAESNDAAERIALENQKDILPLSLWDDRAAPRYSADADFFKGTEEDLPSGWTWDCIPYGSHDDVEDTLGICILHNMMPSDECPCEYCEWCCERVDLRECPGQSCPDRPENINE